MRLAPVYYPHRGLLTCTIRAKPRLPKICVLSRLLDTTIPAEAV